MSGEDFAILRDAAQKLWPDAVISNSGILLGLAKIAAKGVSVGEKTAKSKHR